MSYDSYGPALGALPGLHRQLDYGWLGQHQRPIEHAGAIRTIEMGARQSAPALGRFLEVDAVEGDRRTTTALVWTRADIVGKRKRPTTVHRWRREKPSARSRVANKDTPSASARDCRNSS